MGKPGRPRKQKPLEEQVKEKAKSTIIKPKIELISSGCDILDIHIGGGFPVGTIINIAGPPSAAKTMLILKHISRCIKSLAEKFKWRYDDVEYRMLFDTEDLFGFPILDDNLNHSRTIEEFNYNFTKFCKGLKKGERALYVVDSLDMLPPQDAVNRSEEEYKTMDVGKKYEKGTYALKKQMYLSADFFNQKAAMARDHNCTLIFISQLRANIGAIFGEKWKKSGGCALNHQNTLEIWLEKIGTIKKDKIIREIKRSEILGMIVRANTKKNSVTGKRSKCVFEVLDDIGIDNVASNIKYLFGDNCSSFNWDGKEFKGRGKDEARNLLIRYIEENNQEEKLIEEIKLLRKEIQESFSSSGRKKIY